MDLISVIVPIYNVEKYLNKCIESIVSQTYKDLEILLVDDGSTDGSPAICDSWAEKDSRIKVIHKQNGGLSDARNTGFAASTGDFISFIDSDDWIEPKYYAVLTEVMQKTGCDISGANFRKVGDACDPPVQPLSLTETEYSAPEVISALIDDKVHQIVVNKLYPRSLIADIPFPVGKLHEDEFWSYPVLGKVKKYAESDYIGYNYYQRENSIILGNYSLKRLDAVEAKKQRQIYIDTHFPELSSKAALNLLGTCIYHGQLSLLKLSGEEQKTALVFLKSVVSSCKFSKIITKKGFTVQSLWPVFAKTNFTLCCKIRNRLNIGF